MQGKLRQAGLASTGFLGLVAVLAMVIAAAGEAALQPAGAAWGGLLPAFAALGLGLAGCAVWRTLQSLPDAPRRGRLTAVVATPAALMASTFAYLGLAVLTLCLVFG